MVLPPAPENGAPNWIGTVLRNNGIRTASALVAATRTHQGQTAAIIESFPADVRTQVISLAAAVQICPNYPMVQNWLSTEPYFPPDQEQNAAPGEVAPPEIVPILALAAADPPPRDPKAREEIAALVGHVVDGRELVGGNHEAIEAH
jgi:hypothetical protein